MQRTQQQIDFHNEVTDGSSHLALLARAGTGKTTTILEGALRYMDKYPQTEMAICAYNKAIADEMKQKMQSVRKNIPWKTLNISTIHSMGYGMVKYKFGAQVVGEKTRQMWEDQIVPSITNDTDLKLGTSVVNLVNTAKGQGFGIGGANFPSQRDDAAWYEMDSHFDICDLDPQSLARAIELAKYLYALSIKETSIVDFDDMILHPLYYRLRTRFTKDLIFIDEAQDLSPARQALVDVFLKPNTGRMVIVGDDKQAIYGFSGADAASMDTMIERYEAKVMPLTISWRCSVDVIEEAHRYVEDIQAAPNAPQGAIYKAAELPEYLDKNDAILCRNTAPLVKLAYKLLRAGTQCRIEGKAIGAGLTKYIDRWKIKKIDDFLDRMEDHVKVKRNDYANKPRKLQELEEQFESLKFVAEYCQSQKTGNMPADTHDMRLAIHRMFSDDITDVVVLCTYHRSKGREWDNVYLIEHDNYCPSKYAKKQWQLDQEDNLAYVAITRAKQTLTYVSEDFATDPNEK